MPGRKPRAFHIPGRYSRTAQHPRLERVFPVGLWRNLLPAGSTEGAVLFTVILCFL